MRSLIQAYVDRGWFLTPLAPGTKRPIEKGWPETATNNVITILNWLDRDHPCNLAVVCAQSNLVVIDVDTKNDQPGLATLDRKRAEFPVTLTASTPSGGRHLFYARPLTVVARNMRSLELPGCELIGRGCVTVAPSGLRVAGRAVSYAWVNAAPVAPLPQWLVTELTPAPRVPFSFNNTYPPRDSFLDRRINGCLSAIAVATVGARNTTLNRQAHLIGRLLADCGRDPLSASLPLLHVALAIGLPSQEATATIGAALRAGAAHADRC